MALYSGHDGNDPFGQMSRGRSQISENLAFGHRGSVIFGDI